MHKIYFVVILICISLHATYNITFKDPAGCTISTVEIDPVEAQVIKCLISVEENFTGQMICFDGKPDIKSNFYLYPYIGIYPGIMSSYFMPASNTSEYYRFMHLGIEGNTIVTQVTSSPLQVFPKVNAPDEVKLTFVNLGTQIATDAQFSIIVPNKGYLKGNINLTMSDPVPDKLYIQTSGIGEHAISLNRYIGLPNYLSILSHIIDTANTNYYFLHRYYVEYSKQNVVENDTAKLDKFWLRTLKKHLESYIDWGKYFCGLPERLNKRNRLLKIPEDDMLTISAEDINQVKNLIELIEIQQLMSGTIDEITESLQELDTGIWS